MDVFGRDLIAHDGSPIFISMRQCPVLARAWQRNLKRSAEFKRWSSVLP